MVLYYLFLPFKASTGPATLEVGKGSKAVGLVVLKKKLCKSINFSKAKVQRAFGSFE